MFFPPEQIHEFECHCTQVLADLRDLQLKIVLAGEPFDVTSRVREQLLHGAARRVGVIRRSIENVFSLFPPSRVRPLDQDTLADVQINLHAFVMNMYGIYDNWAWAYVLRHDLEAIIGDRRRIGLFNDATRRRLPVPLRDYLSSSITTKWHEEYAKSFRDALAHRIPPYIPPAEFTPEEGSRWKELEVQKIGLMLKRDWTRLDSVYSDQEKLGKPCFTFIHAFNEDTPARPVILHGQMISDGMAVSEFGQLFLKHWEEAV